MYSFKKAVVAATNHEYQNVVFIAGVRMQVELMTIKYRQSEKTQTLIKKLIRCRNKCNVIKFQSKSSPSRKQF